MVYEDPLARFKIEALSNWVRVWADPKGFGILATHIHEILFAIILYQTQYLVSGFIFKRFSFYQKLSRRTQINFDIHVVSFIQSVTILAILYPQLYDPDLAKDSIGGYKPYSGFLCAMACGYFAWDSYICLRYSNMFGFVFAIHGISAFFVYSQSFRPYVLYYGPVFLVFELSTPFLNVHWLASHVPNSVPEKVQVVNGIILIITFFMSRIVWGLSYAVIFYMDILSKENRPKKPLWVPLSFILSNVALNSLNIMWFSKMIQIVIKRFGSKEKVKAHSE